MKKILPRCLIGVLLTTALALIFSVFINVDMSFMNVIQSAVIFFVIIVSAELARERLKSRRRE